MPMRWTRRTIQGLVIVATLFAAPEPALTQDRDAVRDPVAYVAQLRERGLVSRALQPQLQDIARVLVSHAGSWPSAHVNGAYDDRAINIYLVKTRTGGGADPGGLTERAGGTLLAFPRERLIITDSGFLAEVKAAATIYWESIRRQDHSVRTYDALAIAKIEGPEQAVRSRVGAGADWQSGTNEAFEGAAALLLAHEMGHLALGLDPALEAWVSRPRGLQGPDRDRFWACQSLVGANIEQTRRQEAAADLYAARLLAKIPHPSPPRRLMYEQGALFLRNAELGVVVAMLAALQPNPRVRELMAQELNPDVVHGMAGKLSRDAGIMETIFPSTHPSAPDRMSGLYEVFAATPQSGFYGRAGSQQSSAMLQMLIQQMCASIMRSR
jgi:hypothetical protein